MLRTQVKVATNAKQVISCYDRVSGEINARHDIVVNNILNNILIKRRLVSNEQKWGNRKTAGTAHEEITVWTNHKRSDQWKSKGRNAGARLKQDLVSSNGMLAECYL